MMFYIINFVIGMLVMLSTGVMTLVIVRTLRNFYTDPEYSSARIFLSDSTTWALKITVLTLVIYGVIASIAGFGMWIGVIPESSLMRREIPGIFAVFVTIAATNFFRVISNVTEKGQGE